MHKLNVSYAHAKHAKAVLPNLCAARAVEVCHGRIWEINKLQ